MKNIALSIAIIILLGACSSGSTVADTPFNLTGVYNAEFENARGTEDGNFILNIAEDESGNIVGNLIYERDDSGSSDCEINSLVSGNTSGFSVIIVANIDSGDGAGGTINYQLTQSNSGRTLSGTYVGTGIAECSNASGSGTVVMNR